MSICPVTQNNCTDLIIKEEKSNNPKPTITPKLTFWFPSRNSRPLPVINYNLIDLDIESIDTLNVDKLLSMYDKYVNLHEQYIAQAYDRCTLDAGVYGIPKFSPYESVCTTISNKIEKFYPKYKEIILFSNTDYANGYQLYSCNSNIFDVSSFLFLKELYEDDKNMSYDEFKAEFDDTVCSDWAKMDEHGECFGGFWQSDDPEIKENAYNLSHENNCRKLYELPFSSKIKFWSVKFGCSRRQESVRWTNFWCEWIKRKILQMSGEIEK